MIEPIAAQVGVTKDMIYANTLLYNEDGSFKSHLDTEPTSRAGGKAKVVADLKAEHGYKTVVMVGDGATDMEVRAQLRHTDAPTAVLLSVSDRMANRMANRCASASACRPHRRATFLEARTRS